MKMEIPRDKKMEVRCRSKVTKENRTVIPKEIREIYEMSEGDVIEWIYDGAGNTKIEVKEIVLKDKKTWMFDLTRE